MKRLDRTFDAGPYLGQCPGSFGELIQGRTHPVEGDFLITNPVALFSRAWFLPDLASDQIEVFPAKKKKCQRAVDLLSARFGDAPGGKLYVESDIPEGKGISSSTSDIVAALRALLSCFGDVAFNPGDLAKLACSIEPSDGVMYEGYVAFNHTAGQVLHVLPEIGPMVIAAIDEGGMVDTQSFNDTQSFDASEYDEYRSLLDDFIDAIRSENAAAIGELVTTSARMAQRRNPKQRLEECVRICKSHGGLGVVAAHSGTCLGLLFPAHSKAGLASALVDLSSICDCVFTVNSYPHRSFDVRRQEALSGDYSDRSATRSFARALGK